LPPSRARSVGTPQRDRLIRTPYRDRTKPSISTGQNSYVDACTCYCTSPPQAKLSGFNQRRQPRRSYKHSCLRKGANAVVTRIHKRDAFHHFDLSFQSRNADVCLAVRPPHVARKRPIIPQSASALRHVCLHIWAAKTRLPPYLHGAGCMFFLRLWRSLDSLPASLTLPWCLPVAKGYRTSITIYTHVVQY
jgi:hypothetical protein